MKYNVSCNETQKQLASQGRKPMFWQRSIASQLNINVLSFNTYVSSILIYGCEDWVNHSEGDIEKIQYKFI